jgi:SulP family sulfate permease
MFTFAAQVKQTIMSKIFKPKLFSLLKEGISINTIRKDLLAGIIVGIVALPLAIAFAVASGVSPEKGLITAIIAGFIISFLGGSRVQIGGPTGAFIIIVFGVLQEYGLEGLMISTILAGVMLVAFGLLRMGSILTFIPQPLIVGFTSGIALVIFSTQIKDALGLQLSEVPSDFIDKWYVYLTNLDKVNITSILITISTILITVYSGKLIKKIPGSFIAIILITAATALFGLDVSTIESVFGAIPTSFSIDIPSVDIGNIGMYIKPAFTIAVLGAIESLLSAVVADGMISGKHRSNTELIAQGVANIITPVFGGIPATGAIARTATNVKNGGRTPIAGIMHAVTLLLIMLFFGKLAMLIPMPCLAGILIVVSYNMSEWRTFRSILKGSAYDIVVLVTTFALTVLVDLSLAIEIGIVLSALLFMYRMAKIGKIIPVDTDTDSIDTYGDLPKGVDMFEISGPFFFAAAKQYQEALVNLNVKAKVIILRMRHVPFIDSTGMHNFKETLKHFNNKNIEVVLSGVNNEVSAILKKSGIEDYIPEDNIIPTYTVAVERAKNIIDKM